MEDRHTLRRVELSEIGTRNRPADDPETEAATRLIMDAVRDGGQEKLADYARDLDGNPGRLWYGADDFSKALAGLSVEERGALNRAADRIGAFATAQLAALSPVSIAVPGGRAGHEIVPVKKAVNFTRLMKWSACL